MKTISKEELKELYDKDFPLWAEINLKCLGKGNFIFSMLTCKSALFKASLSTFDEVTKEELRL